MKTTESIGCRFKIANFQKLEARAKQLGTTCKTIIQATEQDSYRTLEATRTVTA